MVFSVGVCIVLLNYGGAFGVIPSLVKESYGAKLMATMYGVALTAWGVEEFYTSNYSVYERPFRSRSRN